MDFVRDDLTMYYDIRGSGTPVLMLHGLTLDHHTMVGAMEPVFGNTTGWQRIYVDLPGMGRTTGGSAISNQDDVVDVLFDFVNDVVGDRHFCVMGYSYGGYLARGLLHRMPDRVDGLMLLAPVVPDRRDERVLAQHRVIAPNPEALAKMPPDQAASLDQMVVVQDDTVLERIEAELAPGRAVASAKTIERIEAGGGFTVNVDELTQPYDRPVLVVTGRQDSITGFADAYGLVADYPRATYAVLDRAGHGAHLEQPELFNALVAEWLDRVVEATPGSL